MPAKRGQCATCRFRYPLRKDGTVQAHSGCIGSERQPPCEGGGKPPVPYDPNLCGACQEYYWNTPGLSEAIWSVAIESPKSGEQVAWEFLEAFHEAGHQEAA
jgi:hypothetical protein